MLSPKLSITAMKVPHQDEFSETAAYKIKLMEIVFCLFQILTNGIYGIAAFWMK